MANVHRCSCHSWILGDINICGCYLMAKTVSQHLCPQLQQLSTDFHGCDLALSLLAGNKSQIFDQNFSCQVTILSTLFASVGVTSKIILAVFKDKIMVHSLEMYSSFIRVVILRERAVAQRRVISRCPSKQSCGSDQRNHPLCCPEFCISPEKRQ